tara:strand:+ start:151 stop:312 length:162 start_codon:yes stop_codon:yes gene_type:complete
MGVLYCQRIAMSRYFLGHGQKFSLTLSSFSGIMLIKKLRKELGNYKIVLDTLP